MNVIVIVVDSLRNDAVQDASRTPFFARLARETVTFPRAYATECWTLPSHVSMFTGLLPSQHGAHFQSLGYRGTTPCVAETFAAAGHHTEIVTRNSIFDGSIPGVTRGFAGSACPRADVGRAGIASLFLALSKPRFRRQIRSSGFFSAWQRDSREFVRTFAHSMLPADERALTYTLERVHDLRRAGRPHFFFLNLYDVHAPYCPSSDSMFRPLWPPSGWPDRLLMPLVLARLGGHRYLRPGFRLSEPSRRLLVSRYRRAVTMMDAKLSVFWDECRRSGILDDTVLLITSDHGEAFGEHGLYLHDASVYDTHLHVPLFVHHPMLSPATVEDVVSLRGIAGLLQGVLRRTTRGTILDPGYRAANPIAVAEHFHYPHATWADRRYRRDLVAAISRERKVIVRGDLVEHYSVAGDPGETEPERAPVGWFAELCRRNGVSADAAGPAVEHLARWERGRGAAA